MTYDLIVAGGGPAGASCARRAAQLGLDVLVIEKEVHPRRKACGGGLTLRVKDVLDFDFSSVVEREQCGLRLFSPSGLEINCHRPEVTGYTVRREDFDHLLLKKAIEAGATVIQGVKVIDVEELSDCVRVQTDDGIYSSRLLVGADGANSKVGRVTGLMPGWKDDQIGLCIEASVPMDSDDIMCIVGDPDGSERILIEIYFGALTHGYAWAFGKNNEFSLGIGTLVCFAKDLKTAWTNFVSKFEERYGVRCDLSAQTAARVPLKGPIKNTYSKRVMLIGDAAGFVSPATGEGLYYAIRSGQIAAENGNEVISGTKGVTTKKYQKRWRKEYGKELDVANFLAGMMFHSVESMELVCQMAYEDKIMREYTMELVMALRPYRESRNRMMKRMLRKHPKKAIQMII